MAVQKSGSGENVQVIDIQISTCEPPWSLWIH